LFNACAPEQWRRFTMALHRSFARQAGAVLQPRQVQVQYIRSIASISNST